MKVPYQLVRHMKGLGPLLLLLLSHANSQENAGMCSSPDEQLQEFQVGWSEVSTQVAQLKEALAVLSDRLDKQESQIRALKEELWLGSPIQTGKKTSATEWVKVTNAGDNAIQKYGAFQGKVLARFKAMFYDHFTLLAAVKADATVTCMYAMHKTSDGLSRYVVLGDAAGDLNFFSTDGRLLYEHPTGTTSAVTAMVSVGLDRNRTSLFTGHRDGTLRRHVVENKVIRPYAGAAMEYAIEDVAADKGILPSTEDGGDGDLALITSEIRNLHTTRIDGKKALYMTDKSGLVVSMWINGSVIASLQTGLTIHSMRFDYSENSQVAILHEKGLSILPNSGSSLRHMECVGLNKSYIEASSFDYTTPSRAYAATDDGDLLTMIIEKNFVGCTVHRRQSIRLQSGPFVLDILKGYMIVSSNLGIAIYNTTMSMRSGPREALLESYTEIASRFGKEVEQVITPQMTTGSNLVVLGFGADGIVGIFQSHLPIQKPTEFNPRLWQQPLFIGAMVLVGFWQFSKHRAAPASNFSSGRMPRSSAHRW